MTTDVIVPATEAPAGPPTAQQIEVTLRTAGQRQINRIWEMTQAFLVVVVSMTALYVSASLSMSPMPNTSAGAFLILSNAFFMVAGFYLGRSNHTRVGGIGLNPNEDR